MEEIHHFSHDHPLTFFEDKEVDEDPKPYFCGICGLPILCGPSYACNTDGCTFFLHKPCAQLPKTLKTPKHHPVSNYFRHTASLKRPNIDGKLSQNFAYVCDSCDFSVHPLVAGEMEIKIKHKSHQSHPLVAMDRETLSQCDVCGEEHRGFFFSCQECHFWIHPDCTLLPTDLKIASHPHSLLLMHSFSTIIYLEDRSCKICWREAPMDIALYFCCDCGVYAHVSCAKSKVESLYQTETRLELPDDGGTYPSLVIRRYVERIDRIAEDHHQQDYEKLTIDEKYHKHPNLILHHDGIGSSSSNSREACNLVCDVCIKPIEISSPFYTCQLQSDECCRFLLHNICANLLSRIDFSAPLMTSVYHILLPCQRPSNYVFNSILPCCYCRRPSNGFCCHLSSEVASPFADLECLVAPTTMKHASHGHHVLRRETVKVGSTIPRSCCPGATLYYDVYICIHCDFCIHVSCALLPQRTWHKFDEHPLELIMSHNNNSSESHRFCEFCEQDIDHKYWYYGCDECEQYFHINCIPSVGYLSKVKFGGSVVDDKIHHHPITLTRMLTVERNERCGYCKDIIKGLVDEMAFHCSHCDFWIHFSCARNASSTPKLKVYQQVREYVEEFLANFLRAFELEYPS